MFVGHLAVAFAAKRWEPNVNLGWLVAGVTALDLVWPIFVITGLEHATVSPGATAFTPIVFDSYPWSHSLVMTFVWGLLLVAIARVAKVTPKAWTLLAALVMSHWVLDVITHAPDMPIWPGEGPKVGLALWNSIPATLAIEGALWVIGIGAYMQALSRKGQRPGWLFWAFVIVSTVMWASGPWMAPPPDTRSLGWFALIGWIVIPWAALADRFRRQRSTA